MWNRTPSKSAIVISIESGLFLCIDDKDRRNESKIRLEKDSEWKKKTIAISRSAMRFISLGSNNKKHTRTQTHTHTHSHAHDKKKTRKKEQTTEKFMLNFYVARANKRTHATKQRNEWMNESFVLCHHNDVRCDVTEISLLFFLLLFNFCFLVTNMRHNIRQAHTAHSDGDKIHCLFFGSVCLCVRRA